MLLVQSVEDLKSRGQGLLDRFRGGDDDAASQVGIC